MVPAQTQGRSKLVAGRKSGKAFKLTQGAAELRHRPPHSEAERRRPDTSDWGPTPPVAAVVAGIEENKRLQLAARGDALAGAYTRDDVAALAGVTPQSVSDMAKNGRLVGLKHGREWRFPAWQFTPDAADPILPGLDRLAAAFPSGVVSLSRWMTTPTAEFDDETPRQVMAQAPERVIAVAGALTAAGR